MLPVEEPFLGRVLLWVTAGQDPTGAVHFLRFLSDPSCPAEGKAGLCQRTCICYLEVHLWGSVSKEQCFKGLSTNLPFGSRFSRHEQSSYRPQIACSSGIWLFSLLHAYVLNGLSFHWQEMEKLCKMRHPAPHRALLGPFLQACHCLWRSIYINLKKRYINL